MGIFGCADSSFNSGNGDRKNSYSYRFQLGRSSGMFIAICERSTLIAQSSTKAEFYCLVEACRELLWIRSFLGEILKDIPRRKIFQDNTPTINTVSHEGENERSKHIDVKFHFVMKLKSSGKIEFVIRQKCALTSLRRIYPTIAMQGMQLLCKDLYLMSNNFILSKLSTYIRYTSRGVL